MALGLTVAAILASPVAPAAAKPATDAEPATIRLEAHFKGSDGFEFQLALGSGEATTLSGFRHDHGGGQIVRYEVADPPPVSDDGSFDLKVGRLGRFQGHFVPTSQRPEEGELEPGCTGQPGLIERGFVVGSFVFRGKLGFSRIDAHRAKAQIARIPASVCPERRLHTDRSDRQRAEAAAKEEHELTLIAGTRSPAIRFEALRSEPPGTSAEGPTLVLFTASDRTSGGLTTRSADFGVAPKSSSLVSPDPVHPLAEATVEASAPYSGYATFRLEGPTKASWTGDLKAELPGLGPVAMAGPKFSAGLCERVVHCTKTLPPLLRPRFSFASVSDAEVQTIR